MAGSAELPELLGDAQPQQGGSVVYAIESDIPSFDPHITFGGSNKRVVMSVFEGLVKRDRGNVDPDAKPFVRPAIVPALAESWDVLEDGTRYRFKLRPGVTFHDGTPFNADAVVFNFRRVIDPEFEHFFERASSLRTSPLRHLVEVEAVDDLTVDLVLDQPWGPFLSQLGTFLAPGLPLMMSPQSVVEYGNEGANTHPAGTGPFMVTAIEPGVKVTTERNPDYWDAPLPYLDRVTYVVMPEQSTRVFALESGEVDLVTQLSPDNVERLGAAGYPVVKSALSNQMWYMAVNMSEPYFQDARVRQAVSYAINREALTDQLLKELCIPSDGMAFPTSPLWDDADRYPYDPEKAKELLAEAGYPDGIDTKIEVPTSGSSMLIPVPMAEWIQRDLAAANIRVEILTHDWVTYLGYWVNGLEPGVGFNVMSWASDYDEFWGADLFSSGSFGNTGHIDDPEIDAAWQNYETAATEEERVAIAGEIFDRVDEQAYEVPVCSEKIAIVTSPRVKGVMPLTDPTHLPEYWWVEG
jgi:peptide/nickel transport system substrate-binding protein